MFGANRMYRTFRPFIAGAFYYSGLVPLVRWCTRIAGHRVLILTYHRASGGNLRRHLAYLQRHYRVVSLQAALDELYGFAKMPKSHDRRTPLVITFDDGYFDSYTHAYALARALGIPITIFLIVDYIGRDKRFHWLEGAHLAQHTDVDDVTIEGHAYHLRSLEDREALAQAIYFTARHAGSVAEREEFLASVRKQLVVPRRPAIDDKSSSSLGWPEVAALRASGWVTLGAHTMGHPTLSQLADRSEMLYEISESRNILEQRLNQQVFAFAYPYGKIDDIGEYGPRAVQDAGYKYAVTAIPGFNTRRTNPYLLRRMPTDVSEHWLVLASQVAGIWWGVWRMLPSQFLQHL